MVEKNIQPTLDNLVKHAHIANNFVITRVQTAYQENVLDDSDVILVRLYVPKGSPETAQVVEKVLERMRRLIAQEVQIELQNVITQYLKQLREELEVLDQIRGESNAVAQSAG